MFYCWCLLFITAAGLSEAGSMTCSKLVGYSVVLEFRYKLGYLNEASTIFDCEEACTSDTTCVAFLWYVSSNLCYLVPDSLAIAVNIILSPGSQIYTKDAACLTAATCSKLVGYSFVSDAQYLYGYLSQASTLWDCEQSCTNDVTCVAFNWGPITNVCYRIPNIFALTVNIVKSTGNLIYSKNASCSSIEQARNKPAIQSQQYQDKPASYAVDGSLLSCSVTINDDNTLAWWQVDLQDQFTVLSVTIFGSTNEYDKSSLTSFVVLVNNIYHNYEAEVNDQSSQVCFSHSSSTVPQNAKISSVCSSTLRGRYVTIKRTENGGIRPNSLTLCEVNIMAIYSPFGLATASTTTTKAVLGSPPIVEQQNSTAIVLGVVLSAIFVVLLVSSAILVIRRQRITPQSGNWVRMGSTSDVSIIGDSNLDRSIDNYHIAQEELHSDTVLVV